MKYNDNGTYEDIVIKAVAPGRNSYSTSQQEVYSCNYTNGAIDAVDTKVNRNSNYSTTEQVVGTWIDGKPLYRKVLQFTNTMVDVGESTSNFKHNVSNIDFGYVVKVLDNFDGSGSGWFDATTILLNNQFYHNTFCVGETSIHSNQVWAAKPERSWIVIMEYTKTTD